jgi:uncharacterized protein YndB with AHSA1/START domain
MSDMVITRTFDAPIEAVWRTWHEPELVRQWWGPAGFTSPRADMDLREGGRSLVCMRAPKEFGGQDFYNTWTYSRIVPMERIEFVSHLTDEHGEVLDPATLGLPPGIPKAVPHVVTFGPAGGGRTELTVAEHGYTTDQARDISRAGMEQCLDKMAASLAQTRQTPA